MSGTQVFTSLKERIDELVASHGSLRAVSAALGVDHVYLHRLRKGQKKAPSDEVLKKLGLRRQVIVLYFDWRKP